MYAHTRTLILLFSLASVWLIGLPPSTAPPATPTVPTAAPATPTVPTAVPATPILPNFAPATPILPTSVPATPTLPTSAPETPILPTSVPATPTLPTPETPIFPTAAPTSLTLPAATPTSAPPNEINFISLRPLSKYLSIIPSPRNMYAHTRTLILLFALASVWLIGLPPSTAAPANPTVTTFTQGNDDDWPEEDDELPVSSWPENVPWPDNWTPRAEDCANAPNPRNATSNNLGRRHCHRPNLQVLAALAAWTVVIAVALAFLIRCMTAYPR